MTTKQRVTTPDTLTVEQVREHLAWLQAGQYKLGDGPRVGLDKREAMRDCVAAIAPSSRSPRSSAPPSRIAPGAA